MATAVRDGHHQRAADVVYLTLVVVVVTVILGAVLGAIDIGFGWLIEKTLLS